MTRYIALATVAALGMLAGPLAAEAGSKPTVDHRQAAQQEAIEAGRQNGSITYFEGLKLRREQKRIAEVEQAYKSDGKLDRYERQRLNELLDNSRGHIREEKSDGWRRWLGLPRVGR